MTMRSTLLLLLLLALAQRGWAVQPPDNDVNDAVGNLAAGN